MHGLNQHLYLTGCVFKGVTEIRFECTVSVRLPVLFVFDELQQPGKRFGIVNWISNCWYNICLMMKYIAIWCKDTVGLEPLPWQWGARFSYGHNCSTTCRRNRCVCYLFYFYRQKIKCQSRTKPAPVVWLCFFFNNSWRWAFEKKIVSHRVLSPVLAARQAPLLLWASETTGEPMEAEGSVPPAQTPAWPLTMIWVRNSAEHCSAHASLRINHCCVYSITNYTRQCF